VVAIRRHRSSLRSRVTVAVVGAQVAAVVAAAAVGGLAAGAIVTLVAALLSFAWFAAQQGVHMMVPRGRWHLYLGLWPFFAWWLGCAVFTALGPLALAVAALPWVSSRTAFGAAGVIAGLCGLRGIWRRPRVVRVELGFADLPEAFEGYRIGQISDVHCGLFAPEARVRSWARLLDAQGVDLVAITGDLVAHGTEEVDAVSRALGDAHGRDGAFACLGNHEYFGASGRIVGALERAGIQVLRNRSAVIHRGDASIVVAGVDDMWSARADLSRALARRDPDAFTVLLAHDPSLFPEAARSGVHLTLSGHTHGGQIGLPFFARRWNLARLAYVFTSGVYRSGTSVLYVNRGAGTSGPPIRLGVPAEITVLTLRRDQGANAAATRS
jgi:uncharacterized protein